MLFRSGENEYEILFLNEKRMIENAITHDKNMDGFTAQLVQNALAMQARMFDAAMNQQAVVMSQLTKYLDDSQNVKDLRARRVEDAFDTREKERIESQEMQKGGD